MEDLSRSPTFINQTSRSRSRKGSPDRKEKGHNFNTTQVMTGRWTLSCLRRLTRPFTVTRRDDESCFFCLLLVSRVKRGSLSFSIKHIGYRVEEVPTGFLIVERTVKNSRMSRPCKIGVSPIIFTVVPDYLWYLTGTRTVSFLVRPF